MQASQIKAFYHLYLDLCNAHDFDRLSEFVSEDVHVNGEVIGLERYKRGLASVITSFPDYYWRLDHLIAEEDWISAQFTDQGTHLGEFRGVPATGRSVTTLEFALYHVVGGKIAEVWVTADNLSVMEQITKASGRDEPAHARDRTGAPG